MLKIRRMPPPEPCRGLREETDLPPEIEVTPPTRGRERKDFTGEMAFGQAVLFIFLVRPSKNPYLSRRHEAC